MISPLHSTDFINFLSSFQSFHSFFTSSESTYIPRQQYRSAFSYYIRNVTPNLVIQTSSVLSYFQFHSSQRYMTIQKSMGVMYLICLGAFGNLLYIYWHTLFLCKTYSWLFRGILSYTVCAVCVQTLVKIVYSTEHRRWIFLSVLTRVTKDQKNTWRDMEAWTSHSAAFCQNHVMCLQNVFEKLIKAL